MSEARFYANEQPGPKPDAAQLLSTIEAGLKRLAAKHWAQVEDKMIEQGYAPAKGGVLVIPQADDPKTPGHRPAWVRFSASVERPALINPRAAGLMP